MIVIIETGWSLQLSLRVVLVYNASRGQEGGRKNGDQLMRNRNFREREKERGKALFRAQRYWPLNAEMLLRSALL